MMEAMKTLLFALALISAVPFARAEEPKFISDMRAEFAKKGVIYFAATPNSDGSITISNPNLTAGGKHHQLAKHPDNHAAFCSMINMDPVGTLTYDSLVGSQRAVLITKNALSETEIKIQTKTEFPEYIKYVSCRPKPSPESAAALAQEILKKLREVNGVDIKPDGSVVIDKRIAKNVTVIGEEGANNAPPAPSDTNGSAF